MPSWSSIYNKYHTGLLRQALRYLHDRPLVEDMVHDIFLSLLEKNTAPIFMEKTEAYLSTAVYRKCISHYRSKKKVMAIDEWDKHYYPATNHTEEQVLYRELKRQYRKAINALSPKEKQVYMLTHHGGYKTNALASLLDKSVLTIKKQSRLSAKKVRTALLLQRA
ncbi:RNA polymerase sigma factor [Sediminibacterium sp.]|uniref:RNA polymerase sigma factor n=1 Tax=Sediminibacterium sp. TaxID=1917865 RepID=UPI003F69CE65